MGLVGRILRSQVFGQRRLIFALSATEAMQVPPIVIEGYQVRWLAGWPRVRQELYEPLGCHRRHLPDEPQQLSEEGAWFWVGWLEGQAANVGVSRMGDKVGRFFFPLTARQCLLSHFDTLPDFRGRGLYRAMLVHIMHEMRTRGVETFFIDCSDWNTASRRGIEHVGFHVVATGVEGRTLRLLKDFRCTAASGGPGGDRRSESDCSPETLSKSRP